ncbi:MAG: histidine kinase [Bacteroidetes bacterium]|nr:histidine kinase [Bacteroidota bacterium]
MLDKKNNSCKTYQATNDKSSGIIGNQIIDIKEDDQGIIWVSSFNGITGIDVEKNKFHSLNNQNGFTSNLTSSMAIDPMNRIWLGVNGALTMIETDRNTISRFTTNDGLSSVGFHEHAACISPNGEIWIPTYIGYLSFNPKEYRKQEPSLPFYVSHYSVFDVENFRINPSDSTPHIRLKPHQNSFTFNMVALNYLNPDKTWYAYRLEGFEDEWHYSSDPKAVYTNVPGGNYNFVYQASKLNASWKNIPVKRILIQLDTIYYKTWWFRALLILAFLSLIGIVYQYRSLQQTKVFELTKNKIDASEAVTFLENLSKSYRYILRNRENETIALSEEIQFAQNYIALQKSRHGSGFEVIFNIDEIHQQSRIVPVTLQNLIENALKHNIMDDESPLKIEIYSEGSFLIIKNNLQRKKSVETSNRSGLAQLQNFYTYLSSSPVQIIESSSHFVVKIPFI